MKKPDFFIGIDMSADFFDAAIYQEDKPVIVSKNSFDNNNDGFNSFISWVASIGASKENSAICLEITGVYSDNICYFLENKSYAIWVEAPHKVHRAFHMQSQNDKLSAIQIAEYLYRYFDKFKQFIPNKEIVDNVRAMLAAREQLTGQKTANRNLLSSVERKHFRSKLTEKVLAETIENLDKQIKTIDKELDNLILKTSSFAPTANALKSVPGIGLLFIANFFCVTNGFQENLNYRRLASYIGICPHQKQSGTSVYSKPRSSGYGPSRFRKLLYLAAMSVKNHKANFNNYFVQKQAQGKNNKLILNNIENKLLKIVCAVAHSGKPYFSEFVSVHPSLLK
jgi:transposase